jgi:trimeric autotransporter adhesin
MMSKAAQSLGLMVLWFGVGLVVSSTAQAQASPAAAPSEGAAAAISVPRLVKFSGIVQDNAGNPRSGITGITFALYKDQSGGAALWLETQNVTLDAQGRYTVLLGANNAEGMTPELFSTKPSPMAGSAARGPGGAALKAADAETLGGRPASSFVLAVPVAAADSGSSGQQSGSATNAALPQATCATPPCNVVTAGGTPNFLSKFQDATTVQNSAIFESGGLVGIGNSSPTRTLDVSGEIRVGGGNIFMQRNLTDLAGRRNWAWGTETFNVGDVSLFVSTSNTSFPSLPVFTALSNGHMGVGLPTPTEALSVAGTIQSTTGGFMFPDATVQTTASLLTGVTAGSGLSGGGKSGSVSLSANFSSVQARVTGTCSSGTAMGSIGADGSVLCNAASGGGSLTLPFSGTGADNPPTVQGVFKVTDTTTGPANGSGGPPDPTTIPAALFGLTTGTGITAGVVGEATNSDGVGVVAISTAAVGDEVPVLVAWSQATSGNVSVIDAMASSSGARGLDMQFAVTPTRGIIQASVGPNDSSTTVFSVDGSGSITTTGTINANGNINSNTSITAPSKTFKIDDPLAPADKWLYHTSVESPDMLNFYNGVVVLDARGQAWVHMPDWFQALNRDFRYQLTAVGKPAPNLYVAREIKDNRFKISGGRPHGKISWQVTGIRHDAYANAHRNPVEEEKSPAERGRYMHPELFGHPEGEAIGAASHDAGAVISAAAGQH